MNATRSLAYGNARAASGSPSGGSPRSAITRSTPIVLVTTRGEADNVEKGYDGWFALVVIPLDEGGIGVLSKFGATKEELTDQIIDPQSPDAPRFINLN